MSALPFSIFRMVQGLTFPRSSKICIFGPWDGRDFSTTHTLQTEVSAETDIVIVSATHENIEVLLKRANHIDFRFNLIIASKIKTEVERQMEGVSNTLFETKEGCIGLILNQFAQPSYLLDCIERGMNFDLDDPLAFLPEMDLSKWKQIRNEIQFDSPEGLVTFRVPDDFSLVRTSPDLLWTVESVLLSPWYTKYSTEWVPTRRPGRIPGLSFSGGIDSTAALCLMPENTILLYMERNFDSMIKHANALHFLDELKREGRTTLSTPSNHEFIRTKHEKNQGFSTDYACMAHLILLADYFDLDAAGTGMPLENSYFFHGSSVRDFSKTRFWKSNSAIFRFLGLPLYQPVAGCSEVLTNKIVKEANLHELAKSCLRSEIIGKTCEQCWKCFRKNIFNQQTWKMSNEISTFLSKRPLKQGIATLFALQQIMKTKGKIPEEANDLLPVIETDLSFLDEYWGPSMDLLPNKYREFTSEKLSGYASPMSRDLYEIDTDVLTLLRGEGV
jgi:hypothetical protein